MTADAIPAGWRIRLDRRTRWVGDRLLLGGAPLRLIRVSDAGARLIAAWDAGTPLGTSPAEQRLAARLVDAGVAHAIPEHDSAGPALATGVVIPVLDDAAGLDATLGSLHAAPDTPVVVVDDGSSPEQAAVIAAIAERHGATLVRHEPNRGPAAARNTGAARLPAAVEVIAFVDAGCVPHPGWLDLARHFGRAGMGAVAPRVRATVEGTRPRALATYEHHRSPLDLGPDAAPVRPTGRVTYVPSTALLVRRRAFNAAGGFDEALRHGEDVDLVWRLAATGWRVRYEPTATVEHPARPTVTAWIAQRIAYGASSGPLARRHPDALAPVRLARAAVPAVAAALGLPARIVGASLALTTATIACRLAHQLDGIATGTVTRLALDGQRAAALALAYAIRRAWSPLLLLSASRSRRARRALALATVALLLDWWTEGRPARLSPATWLALRWADDLAAATGISLGCWRARTARPLLPARAARHT